MTLRDGRWCFCVALAALVAAGVGGCKSSSGGAGRGHPTYLYMEPDFAAPSEAVRVPVAGFVNTTTEAEAANYFWPYLEEAFTAKPSYVVLSQWATEREARRQSAEEQLSQLAAQWRAERRFDPALLRQFGSALGVPYVLGGEVSEWLSEEVKWNVEGYSHSDVAARLKMFDVNTGEVVWEARDRLQMKSAPYDPNRTQDRVDDLGIVRGESRVVPPAPPIDEVARRVAANLAAALP